MIRRTFLTTSSIALLAGGAGCLGQPSDSGSKQNDWSPKISGSEPELEPGETTTLSVEATDIGGLFFSSTPGSDVLEFDFDITDVSPHPEGRYVMHPPAWSWDARTSVELNVPVTVADDAVPGEYHYEVNVFDELPQDNASAGDELTVTTPGEGDELRSVAETFTINVVQDHS